MLTDLSATGRLMSGAEQQESHDLAMKLHREIAEKQEAYRLKQERLKIDFYRAVIRVAGTQAAPQYLLDAVDAFFTPHNH